MSNYRLLYAIIALGLAYSLNCQAQAAPAGLLIKHLSSLLKWTARSTSKTPHSDGNVLQFENGYVVETVVEGNEIGVIPYRIRVSEDGELFAVDSINSNIVRITPPLSQYSRGRLVAGSFQGHTGHVDGKTSDARFNHPKGITMDDRGNVYVADTENLAIRKIGETGVTTIAGGKSSVAGYRDGPSEDAKFSNDFDVVYLRPTCSLLVIDRGNAALRQISLNQEDCDYQFSSISTADILSVVGAIIVGYVTCMLQQGFGSSFSSRMQPSEREFKGQVSSVKPVPILESSKEEPGWPSFGQLVGDLSKISLESLVSGFFQFIPFRFRSDSPRRGLTPLKDRLQMPEDEVQPPFRSDGPRRGVTPLKDRFQMPEYEVQAPFRSNGPKRGLTPLKDRLRMPEDEVQPPLVERQSAAAPLTENKQIHTPHTFEKYSEMKPPKIKSGSFKDPSLSNKHRSSKRQEYAELYGPSDLPPYSKSKSQKERSRHRHREKSGEVVSGSVGAEQKPVDYENPQFNYNMRTKYVPDDSFRFNSQ